MHPSDVQDIEVTLFIQALQLRHGYDFSQYSPASFKRRVQNLVTQFNARSISEITERIVHEPEFVAQVIEKLTVPVSELFREPHSFALLRDRVLPELASYPHINIWQAGCAHGEEVYSLAAILMEAGLYERTHIYATDISDAALARAQEGIYSARDLPLTRENYRLSGGIGRVEDHFTIRYDLIKANDELKRHITFANHNLVSDGVFGEMNLILCRNVLIYFSDALQDRVLRLFRDSLRRDGYLCIGNKESLMFSSVHEDFPALKPGVPVFRVRTA